MANGIWHELYSSLAVDGVPHSPTAEAVGHIEARYGFQLPRSYVEFAYCFGPGILAEIFNLAVPGYGQRSCWFDLHEMNKQSPRSFPDHFLQEVYCPSLPPDEVIDVVSQIQRLVFFCALDGNDYVGWDPEDVSDPGSNEYGIYILPRGEPPVYCVCAFAQFIFDVCLGELDDHFTSSSPVVVVGGGRSEWGESVARITVAGCRRRTCLVVSVERSD